MSGSITAITPLPNLFRYFIQFSYIGAKFSGVAKQANTEWTIHNIIKQQLQRLKKQVELKSNINISSRTDAGVHAIKNTANFDLSIQDDFLNDLKAKYGHRISDLVKLDDSLVQFEITEHVKNSLNNFFVDNSIYIRILECRRVPMSFISRNALSRTYLFRLALSKNSTFYQNEFDRIKTVSRCLNENNSWTYPVYYYNFPFHNFTTVFDHDFLTEIRAPFDRELFLKAIDLLNGTHNFGAFTTGVGRKDMLERKKTPIKDVKITVNFGGEQFLMGFLHDYHEKYEIIDIEVKAKSFLYKMIRKMIGLSVCIANGKLPLEMINSMFEHPEKYYDDTSIKILKSNGLFLKDVEYDKNVFDFEKNE